jgi:uncharacterized protein (DUF362 family)
VNGRYLASFVCFDEINLVRALHRNPCDLACVSSNCGSLPLNIKLFRPNKATVLIRNVTVVLFCAIAASRAQPPQPAPALPPPLPTATPSLVFVDRDSDAITGYRVNGKIVHGMVDRLVMAATGQPDVGRAWASLVSPNDIVGIKISAAGGELFTTHHEVVNAIVDGLVAAGQSRNKIIVWDKSLDGVKEAGYNAASDGYQLKAIPPRDGYDAKEVFTAPVLGKLVWGDFEYRADPGKTVPLSDTENTSNISHFSKIIANGVTKIINVPVMSNTETNGIAGCLYNVTIPNVDNWRRFTQGTGFGAAAIAELYADPHVGRKVVFNLMDGLLAQYAGGPESQPNYSVQHATLYAGKDPVAIDAVALKKLEQWRARSSLPAMGQMTAYVRAASQIGLGNAAPERIETRNVGRGPPE